MTWAERFGDLATNIALVFIMALRIVTLLVRILFSRLDTFVTTLGERSEEGLRPTETDETAWTRLPASVFWGIAAVTLRIASIVTVFGRQLSFTADEFLRTLAEGEA